MEMQQIKQIADELKENVGQVIVGKKEVIDLLFIGLISSGHILLEDVPGTGKTLLAKTMAKTLDCSFQRIQFTPDLLPSDVTGIHYYNQKESEFQFRAGPIFTNILLADEINRATPRTQSSLLECMEERQVSIDGETKKLDHPFMVIATQNPVENQGTFPLPEAQLDRFLMKIKMGYPESFEAVEILKRFKQDHPLNKIESVIKKETILEAQKVYSEVHVSDELLRYIVQIVEKTRQHEDVVLGVSPRGSQALFKSAQVYAILQGRDYVIPDDIKALVNPILAHRLLLKSNVRLKDNYAEDVLGQILAKVNVPTEEKLARGSA